MLPVNLTHCNDLRAFILKVMSSLTFSFNNLSFVCNQYCLWLLIKYSR